MAWSRRQDGPVATLGFARPPANHVRFDDLRELAERLAEVAADESVSVLVLTGEIPGCFIGHADREDLMSTFAGRNWDECLKLWRVVPAALEELPQPVVAALDGPATGGGSELALACTFRVGTTTASFTQHEVSRGLMPGGGATQRLQALIGAPRAARLLMTGATLDAETALAWGVLDALLDGEGLATATSVWLEPLAEHSRAALAAVKRAMREGPSLPRADAFALEQSLFSGLMRELTAVR